MVSVCDGVTSAHKVANDGWVKSQGPFWFIACSLAIALAASATPSPLYVDYQLKWGLSATTITLIYAVYSAGVLGALLTLGGLSDRIGRRPVLLTSMAVLAVAMVLFAVAHNVVWLLVARTVQGVATGVVTGAAAAALSELHSCRDHRFAALVNSTSIALGIAVGAVVAGGLAQWVPARLVTPYVVIGILSLVMLLIIAFVVPETVPERKPLLRSIVRFQRVGVPAAIRGQFALASALVVASWSVGGLYLALGGAIAAQLLDASNHLIAGLVILAVQGSGGITQLLWNVHQPGTTIRRASLYGCVALIFGMIVDAISVAMANAPLFFVGAISTGIGFGLTFMAATRSISVAAPQTQRGEVMAAFFVVAYLAISLPAVMAGLVATHIGIARTFSWFAAVICVITTIVFAISIRRSDCG